MSTATSPCPAWAGSRRPTTPGPTVTLASCSSSNGSPPATPTGSPGPSPKPNASPPPSARPSWKKAPKPTPKLLAGTDDKARDHLLGLALRVEAKAGPRTLAEILTRTPHGTAKQFVANAEQVAKERGITLWSIPKEG